MKTSGGNWKKITKYLLVILVAFAAIFGVSHSKTISSFAKKFFAAGQVPAHSKTIGDNGNGTYKLSLDVTGDATVTKEASNLNVLVIFDTSNSMTMNRVGNTGLTRAQAAETVLDTFTDDLFEYQSTTNPTNIQMALVTFNASATEVQSWTSTKNDITKRLYPNNPSSQNRLSYNTGTNWEAGLDKALDVLATADSDPTYVIFMTDGAPTRSVTNAGSQQYGEDQFIRYYRQATDEAYEIATYQTPGATEANTTLYGVYAFGETSGAGNADYLDDLIYYSQHNATRPDGANGKTNTAGTNNKYFSATDTSELEAAISTIFEDIITAAGISNTTITDGTTQNVETSSGEIAHLLELDESSYEYWLEIPLTRNSDGSYHFTDNNLNDIKVTVSNKVATLTWTDSKGVNQTATYNEASIQNLKLKVKWEDATSFYPAAPEASAETSSDGKKSSVKWDLSSLKTLLNGVKYTVTFDVFPSQETYDLIADLKNGTITYNDLDSEIQKYIVDNGDGSYSLRTNTQATLSYDDTRDEAGVQTKTYDNPDPVGTNVDTIAVKKILDNDIDGRTYGKINLELTRDGKKAFDVELDGTVDDPLAVNPAPGSEVEPWKASGIYIATGLAKTVNGNLVVLDAGHDYTFGELGSELFNWELESITVHPMLIDGVLTELTLVEDSKTCPSGETCYTINDKLYKVSGTNPIITATNHRRSNFNVKKIVNGENANPNDEFEFTIKVTQRDEKNEIIKDNTTTNDDDLWFSVQDKDGNWVDYGESIGVWTRYVGTDRETGKTTYYYYAPNNTELKINLKNNYNIRFTNLVSNTDVSVVESDKDNYSLENIETTSGFDSEKDSSNPDVATKKFTGHIGENNTSYKVEYKNNNDEPETTTVKVTKVWADYNDSAGFRPDKLTITIKDGSGKTVDTQTVPKSKSEDENSWYYESNELPKYINGVEANYSVEEAFDNESNKYTLGDPEKVGTNEYKITNSYTPETTKVKVTKVWSDDSDSAGFRPDELTITIKDNEGNTLDTQTEPRKSEDGNSWYYESKDLPKYKDGSEVTYSVEESFADPNEKYTLGDPEKVGTNEYKITNSYTPETTKVKVTKIWADDNDSAGFRPDELTITIKDNEGNTVDTQTEPRKSEDGNSWYYESKDLPKYKDGSEVTYSVEESFADPKEKYTLGDPEKVGTNEYKITNSYTPETTKVKVTKIWADDNDSAGFRPDKLTITIKDGSGNVVDTQTEPRKSEDGNSWYYESKDLPKYKDGSEVTYSVEESFADPKEKYTLGDPEKVGTNEYKITNSYTPETTEVSVEKVWVDNNNSQSTRPKTIKVTLYANGSKANVEDAEIELAGSTGTKLTHTWENLDKYSGGEEIKYTVDEEPVTNYTKVISGSQEKGWVITNTVNAIPKNIPVTKVWDDKSNQDGKRPTTLEVTITGKVGNETIPGTPKTITLSGSNDTWNGTFANMPTFYNGQLVTYSVSEANIDDYTMVENESNLTNESKGFKFTNKHEAATTTVKVKKTWNDEDNQDGLRTEELIKSVRFNLYGSNETLVNYHYFDPSEDCTDNECVFEFTEDLEHNPLPKYAGGKEITYTIKEEFTSPHYSTDDPNDEDGNYEIINTHTPFTTDVVVYKDWNDSNNQDGLRQDVDVILKAGLLPDFSSQKTITKEACATGIENCKAEWNGLQKFIAGNKIDYKVAEITSVPNYTTEIPDPIVEEGDGYNNTFVFRYVVTNTHTPNTVTIPVKKVWEDANNQDGKRKYVKFELYADNTRVAEHTFEAKDCSGNECTFTFITDGDGISGTKLPEFKPGKVGQPIKYTIKETNLPDGYTSTGPTGKDPYTITNSYEPSTITIPVKKVWNDADDQDGIRDKETITFKLYGAGGKIVAEHTFTADDCSGNNCTFEFKTDGDGINGEELPEYQPGAQGQKINYRIEEIGNSKQYTASEMTTEKDGTLVITNTHNPEPTTVKVKKVWEDANNQDGKRKYVTFDLYGVSTDTPVASHTFTADDCTGNICTFEFKTDGDGITGAELPKFAPGQSGVPIDYTIKETGLPDGYDNNNGKVTTDDAGNLTITNTHTPELVNVPVVKQWVDDGVTDYRPKSITVQLYADKKPVEGKTATITPKTDEQGNEVWEYEFKDLEKYEAGKVGHQINYTIRETVIPDGYTESYDDGTIDDGTTIVNTANETIKKDIPVEKVWDDLTNIEGIRPDSVKFKLVGRVGDKEVVKPYTTTIYKSEDDTNNTARSWIGEFKDVQVFFNGQLINYTLEEVTMDKSGDRYSVDIQGNDKDGYIVTNTSRPETINFTATKKWNDNDDNDGKRPTKITVQLMNQNSGEAVGEEVTLEAENWSYTWENLDQFEEGKQGVKIKYYIVETTEVEGYTPSDYDFETNSITNNHEPITISYKVEKIWDDFDNQDGKRPKSITVRLVGKVNGEVVVPEKVQKIDSTNNWTYEFKNLQKYYKKQLIQYTITEDVVDLYETKPITQVNTTEDTTELSNNVTNKHDLIPYDNTGKITVKKIWKDRDNKFNTRPSSITIHLFADGVEIKKAVLNASNNWTYTFTGLNKYKEGAVGVEVVYTITEDAVKGYNSSIDGFVVTNTMTDTEIVPPKTGVESNTDSNNPLFYIVAIILTTLGATTITFKYER